MTELRAARDWSVPLSVLRGERPPTSVWTEQDGLLAQALTHYEAGLCSGCGHPIAETMGEENENQWESEEFRCHACTANAANAESVAERKLKYPEALRFATTRRDPNEVTFWQKPRAQSR